MSYSTTDTEEAAWTFEALAEGVYGPRHHALGLRACLDRFGSRELSTPAHPVEPVRLSDDPPAWVV